MEIMVTECLIRDFQENGKSFQDFNHTFMSDTTLNIPFDSYIENIFQKSKTVKKYSYYTTDQ